VHSRRNDAKVRRVNPGGEIVLVDKQLVGSGSTVSAILDVRGVTPGTARLTATVGAAGSSEPTGVPRQFAEDAPWRSGVFDLAKVGVQHFDIDAASLPSRAPTPTAILGDDCHPLPSINDGRRKPVVVTVHYYPCYPQKNADGYYDLHGDYGVVRTYVMHISNAAAEPSTLSLYARPRSGVLWGTFLFDDEMSQVANVRPIKDVDRATGLYEIRRIRVVPHERRTLTITTMGQGESAYPADLIFMRTIAGIPKAPKPEDAMEGPIATVPGCAAPDRSK
jgi:hypothetical protein